MLPRTIDAKAVWFNQEEKCDFHLGAIGHRTDRCLGLRHRIQDLIDSGVIKFNFDHGIVSYDLCNIEQHQLRPVIQAPQWEDPLEEETIITPRTTTRKISLIQEATVNCIQEVSTGKPFVVSPDASVAAVTSHLQPMVIKRPFPAITVSANVSLPPITFPYVGLKEPIIIRYPPKKPYTLNDKVPWN